MQTARDLYEKFNGFIGNRDEPSTSTNVGIAASGLGAAGGLGMAGNSLYDLHNLSDAKNKPVAITYGYSKGQGQGHKSIAEAYAKMLNQGGVPAEALTHGAMPSRPSNYSAVIPAGYGPQLDPDVPHLRTSTDYAPGATKPLPFAIASPIGAENALQRSHNVSELAKTYKLGDTIKHIITLAGGETGSALTRKLQTLLDATSHRQDTAILALAANAPDEVKKALAAMDPNRVRVAGALPKDDFLRHLSSSSLNVGYGGSNSVTEQLSMRNPQINMFVDKTLNPVNTNNIDFASRYGGVDSFGVQDTDGLRARIDKVLDNPDMFDRTSAVNRHVEEVNGARGKFIDGIAALRNSNIGKRMRMPINLAAAGIGLATAGGAGLNYFMNKNSSFLNFPNPENNSSAVKNWAGGLALGAGALAMPAAMPFLRIGARNYLARMAKSKSKMMPDFLRQFARKNKGTTADFLADYTEGARRFGDIPGVRWAVNKDFDRKVKYVPENPKGPSHDFQRAHFNRFMSGSNREGLKHWGWEVGQDFENNAWASKARKSKLSLDAYRQLKNNEWALEASNRNLSLDAYKQLPQRTRQELRSMDPIEAAKYRPELFPMSASQKVLEKGRQSIFNPGGLLDDAVHAGKTEHQAISELSKSKDRAVKSFIRALAAHKQNAANVYVGKSMAAPALMIGGAGALAYNPQGPDPSFIDKLRYAFSS